MRQPAHLVQRQTILRLIPDDATNIERDGFRQLSETVPFAILTDINDYYGNHGFYATHQFGVLDLIRAGLQDLDTARTLLRRVARRRHRRRPAMRLLMKTLEQSLRARHRAHATSSTSSKRCKAKAADFHQRHHRRRTRTRTTRHRARRVRRNGQAHALPPRTRRWPQPATHAKAICTTTHSAARMCSKRSVPIPVDHAMPTASLETTCRSGDGATYRPISKQLAAIMAQDATAERSHRQSNRASAPELSDLADAAPGRRARHRTP